MKRSTCEEDSYICFWTLTKSPAPFSGRHLHPVPLSPEKGILARSVPTPARWLWRSSRRQGLGEKHPINKWSGWHCSYLLFHYFSGGERKQHEWCMSGRMRNGEAGEEKAARASKVKLVEASVSSVTSHFLGPLWKILFHLTFHLLCCVEDNHKALPSWMGLQFAEQILIVIRIDKLDILPSGTSLNW